MLGQRGVAELELDLQAILDRQRLDVGRREVALEGREPGDLRVRYRGPEDEIVLGLDLQQRQRHRQEILVDRRRQALLEQFAQDVEHAGLQLHAGQGVVGHALGS